MRSFQKISDAASSTGDTSDWVIRPSLSELIGLSQPSTGVALGGPTAKALQSGQYLSRFRGRGMEFDEARIYMPGDDVRSLDWRVTARTGQPHTKIFREERERPIFLSVDYRASMFFATRGMYKSAMAARLGALLAWSAHRHDDRIGGQIFSESGSLERKPEHGQGAVLRYLKALVERSEVTSGISSEGALEEALVHLPRHAKPGSLVFILSDFRGLTPAGESAISKLSRHCNGVLIMISDPIEVHLPPGRHRYGNEVREQVVDGNQRARAEIGRRFDARRDAIKTLARRHGMRFVDARTDEAPLQILKRSAR